MSASYDTFDSLASRHLDGELTADEQAQFYRLIMRDPAKRQQAEQGRRLDRSAGRALHAVLDAPSRPIRIGALPRQRRVHCWLRLQLLATAALVMLSVGVWQLLAMENQVQRQQSAAANLAVVPAAPAKAPHVDVPAAYATTDEASLALTPPRLPDVTASSALSAGPVGDMWWRKYHSPVTVAAKAPSAASAVSVGAAGANHKPHHYWSALLEAIDPAGKRFEMLNRPVAPATTQPVVNSVSGEL